MPRMSKQQQKLHVMEILESAMSEVDVGHWNNALLITQRAATEILLIEGKRVTVTTGKRAGEAGTHLSSSVIAGFKVLACWKPGITLLGIKEIADITKMPMSTTHRYVRTLITLGQLEQDVATRKYRRV